MDIFHDNPLLAGVRQMLGAFAKSQIRPIAAKHDAEESMPWALMKSAQALGMSQSALLDGRKKLTGVDEEADPKKPKSQARLAVAASEELAWGCAGIALALGGSVQGTPMASHQHIMFELAEMNMEISAARLLAHKAAWMADHHLDNVAEASAAKAYGARVAQQVTTRAMVLLGEEALEPGHPVEKWYRDAKIYDIFEGTGQIQRRIIAKHLTGQNPT